MVLEFAEIEREIVLLLLGQRLVAHDDDVMGEQRLEDQRLQRVRQRRGQVGAGDLDAARRRQREARAEPQGVRRPDVRKLGQKSVQRPLASQSP